MTDQTIDETLQRLFACLGFILKGCGKDLAEIQELLATSYEEAADVPSESVENADHSLTSSEVNHLTQILNAWHSNSSYVDNLGEPLPIQKNGPKPSFVTLVEDATRGNKNDREYPSKEEALERLVRHGVVTEGASGELMPTRLSFPYTAENIIGFLPMLRDITDFSETIYNNASGNHEKVFHAVSSVVDCPTDALPILNRLLRSDGMTFLREIDEFLTSSALEGDDAKREVLRAGVGMYVITDRSN